MTADIDRLDLELRSIPGVVTVGLTDGDPLLEVHVVALLDHVRDDVRERLQNAADLCPEPVTIDLRLA